MFSLVFSSKAVLNPSHSICKSCNFRYLLTSKREFNVPMFFRKKFIVSFCCEDKFYCLNLTITVLSPGGCKGLVWVNRAHPNDIVLDS